MRRLIGRADMRVTQTLSSGLIVRQDFRDAVRFVFFETGLDYWQYATHGGTMFVVCFETSYYAITCRHVVKEPGFRWSQLVVTNSKAGNQIAGIKSVYYPSDPKDAAIGTDILDVAVVQFNEENGSAFFKDCAYILDERTIATSKPGDVLHVAGALKTPSEITETGIAPIYCLLELSDVTSTGHDPTLRTAFGKYAMPEFSDVVGLSGSPVFNVTSGALCGMVARGGMNGDECTLHYIDIFDIMQLLRAIGCGKSQTYYRKTIVRERPAGSKS